MTGQHVEGSQQHQQQQLQPRRRVTTSAQATRDSNANATCAEILRNREQCPERKRQQQDQEQWNQQPKSRVLSGDREEFAWQRSTKQQR